MAETYFITWKGRRDGPYSVEQLESLLNSGDIGLLHSVETPLGTVPLRQLLESLNPAPIEQSAPTNAAASVPLFAPPLMPGASRLISEQEVSRLYAICGWCFAVPPLAWKAWTLAHALAEQGHVELAQRLKWLSSGLALGGLLMWALIWRMW